MVDETHFADGIDSPDRLAFGLSAGPLAVVVVGMLCAYAISRTGLVFALRLPLSLFVALLAAGLGWVPIAGRPSLEWAVFGARFALRRREGSLLILAAADLSPGPPRLATPPAPPAATAAIDPQADVHVVPLFDSSPSSTRGQRARRIVFFSLKGGVGRTTLCVELACWLAECGRRRESDCAPAALRVALLDLDARSPSVAVRLGIPHPVLGEGRPGDVPEDAQVRVMHRSGVQVVTPPAGAAGLDSSQALTCLQRLDDDRFDLAVIDVCASLDAVTGLLLQDADDIFIVVTPTATGVHDAYSTTRLLRRAGLRDRMSCVVNRWRADIDLSEVVADLGLDVVARIPEDQAFVEAENTHGQVSLASTGSSAGAIRSLGEHVLADLVR